MVTLHLNKGSGDWSTGLVLKVLDSSFRVYGEEFRVSECK